MPLVGGTTTWIGPLIGALLLGTLQQVVTVTISSAVNLLIVGVVLVAFVIIAPNGIVGLVRPYLGKMDWDMAAPLLQVEGLGKALRRRLRRPSTE